MVLLVFFRSIHLFPGMLFPGLSLLHRCIDSRNAGLTLDGGTILRCTCSWLRPYCNRSYGSARVSWDTGHTHPCRCCRGGCSHIPGKPPRPEQTIGLCRIRPKIYLGRRFDGKSTQSGRLQQGEGRCRRHARERFLHRRMLSGSCFRVNA